MKKITVDAILLSEDLCKEMASAWYVVRNATSLSMLGKIDALEIISLGNKLKKEGVLLGDLSEDREFCVFADLLYEYYLNDISEFYYYPLDCLFITYKSEMTKFF